MLSLETMSYEEAGHAVAAILLDVPFIKVTLDRLGGHVHPAGPKKLEERYIVITLAGPVARLRFDPDSAWADKRPNSEIIVMKEVVVPEYQAVTGSWDGFDDMYARTEQLIDSHWREVERVADALLEKRELSPDDVRAAMRNGAAA